MIIGNDFEAIMYIRNYQKSDLKSIIFLFRETVHSINSKDYTQEQVKIWAPENIDEKSWHLSLLSHYTLVAIDKEKIVGFVDLDENYVDRLYVAKDYQRQKIATRLMDKIENYAKKQGQISLYSHVSITAKKFFLDRGYIVNKEQYVEKQNILFKNYIMEKFL